MTDCFCSRCNGDGPDCFEGGEHYYHGDSPTCYTCGKTNMGLLRQFQFDKAEKAGLAHGDHFHRRPETKARCTTLFKGKDWDPERDAEAMQELAEMYP